MNGDTQRLPSRDPGKPASMPSCSMGSICGLLAQLVQARGGFAMAATIALAAKFLSEHYGAPAMLFALLIGMAFNFLAEQPGAAPGINLAARALLRMGVALLGLRLTFGNIAQLGVGPVVGVAFLLTLTLAGGVLAARLLRRSSAFGLLTGGAVAICGASAALAIAAVLPKRDLREEDVLFTVVGVTTLSTVAMVVYPVLFAAIGLSEVESGYMIGATVHDVAQVVGAGYSISDTAGEVATFTKLLRVSLLPAILLVLALVYRESAGQKVSMPWFVVWFMLLMVLRNIMTIPEPVLGVAAEVSQFLLLTAIAALGVKTSLGRMFSAGPRGFLAIGALTIGLLLMALAFIGVFPITASLS